MSTVTETRGSDNSTCARPAGKRAPLFPFWVLILLALAIEGGELVLLWPVFSLQAWPIRFIVMITAVNCLGVYVGGEFVRHRCRLSLRLLFLLVAFAAVCSALVGKRLVQARREQPVVATILRCGGSVDYNIDGGFDGWSRTEAGWMLPNWLFKRCGAEMFADVNGVSFGNWNGPINKQQVLQIDFERLATLKEFGFFDVPIKDGDLVRVAKLRRLSGLGLQGTLITDDGLRHLESMRDLTGLNLCRTQTSDAGLVRLRSHTQLLKLNLSATRITDAGLVQLRGMTNLESLWLFNTVISDGGLEELKRHKRLKWIGLTGTNVSAEGIAELQEALPDCVIVP